MSPKTHAIILRLWSTTEHKRDGEGKGDGVGSLTYVVFVASQSIETHHQLLVSSRQKRDLQRVLVRVVTLEFR